MMTTERTTLRHLSAIAFPVNILLSLLAAGLLALIGASIDYYPAGNDLWENHYLGMVMTTADIHSFYDGFFPIGYSLLLKLLVGNGYPAVAAYYVNVALSLLMMIVAAWCLRKQNLQVHFPFWLLLLVAFPRTFRYLITPGPDTAAMALFTIGVLLLALWDGKDTPIQADDGPVGGCPGYPPPAAPTRPAQGGASNKGTRPPEDSRDTPRRIPTARAVLAGLAMGLGALVRYHLFVASSFLLLALFIFMKRERKSILVSCAVFLAIYLPQIAINVLSGHGPLETYHALNFYNLVHGVNWYHMENLLPLPSAKTIVLGAPLLFLKHYLKGVAGLGVFAIAPLIYGLLAKSGRDKAAGFAVGAFCLLYALFFGISASPRAVLPLVPVSLLFFVKILFDPALPLRTGRIALFMTLLCACLFLWKDGQRAFYCRNQNDRYAAMESFFIGQGVKNGQEVFTGDYDQYFKTLFPYRPLFNGGWGRIATYRYNAFYPELNVESIDGFYADCLRRRVRYAVFTPDAAKLAQFCFDLYSGSLADPRFTPVKTIGRDRVFRVGDKRERALGGRQDATGDFAAPNTIVSRSD
jgi:hypothetical protein